MGKTIKYLIICSVFLLLAVLLVASANYEYFYNPYTAKQDRSLSLNQTGWNITADNFLGNVNSSSITSEKWVDIVGGS